MNRIGIKRHHIQQEWCWLHKLEASFRTTIFTAAPVSFSSGEIGAINSNSYTISATRETISSSTSTISISRRKRLHLQQE